jgi:hypothetical protein
MEEIETEEQETCTVCEEPMAADGSDSAGPNAFSGWGIGPLCRECYRMMVDD